jgi:hypothetical protein
MLIASNRETNIVGSRNQARSGGGVTADAREKIRAAILQYLETNQGSHSPQQVLDRVMSELDCHELDLAKAILVDIISRGELALTPDWKLAAAA